MKNSLNNRQRSRKGLIDSTLVLKEILPTILFIYGLTQRKKENEEKERYAEKRRVDLTKGVA